MRTPDLALQSVGVAGFEPTASSSRTKRATKLRHTPDGRRLLYPTPAACHALAGTVTSLLRGTKVSRLASGGQAKRTGAYGEVPRPAET